MTLQNFEQQLNKVQLTKGLDYFESGCISELEEWETGIWNAIAAGSERIFKEAEREAKKNMTMPGLMTTGLTSWYMWHTTSTKNSICCN